MVSIVMAGLRDATSDGWSSTTNLKMLCLKFSKLDDLHPVKPCIQQGLVMGLFLGVAVLSNPGETCAPLKQRSGPS